MAVPFVRATSYHEDLLISLIEMSATKKEFEIINVDQWLVDNQKSFVPPVCNKLMHHT